MPSCAAYGCTRRKSTDSITLHRFPKNESLRKKWIQATRRKDFIPSKSAVLCSQHFKEEDMDRTSLVTVRLREGVVPTIFDAFPSEPSCLQKKTPKPSKPKNHEVAVPVGEASETLDSAMTPEKVTVVEEVNETLDSSMTPEKANLVEHVNETFSTSVAPEKANLVEEVNETLNSFFRESILALIKPSLGTASQTAVDAPVTSFTKISTT